MPVPEPPNAHGRFISARALVREAEMPARLGEEPMRLHLGIVLAILCVSATATASLGAAGGAGGGTPSAAKAQYP